MLLIIPLSVDTNYLTAISACVRLRVKLTHMTMPHYVSIVTISWSVCSSEGVEIHGGSDVCFHNRTAGFSFGLFNFAWQFNCPNNEKRVSCYRMLSLTKRRKEKARYSRQVYNACIKCPHYARLLPPRDDSGVSIVHKQGHFTIIKTILFCRHERPQ